MVTRLAFVALVAVVACKGTTTADAGTVTRNESSSSSSSGDPPKPRVFWLGQEYFTGVVELGVPSLCPLPACENEAWRAPMTVLERFQGHTDATTAVLGYRFDGDGGLPTTLRMYQDYGLTFPMRKLVSGLDMVLGPDAGIDSFCGVAPGVPFFSGSGYIYERDGGWLVSEGCMTAIYCNGTSPNCSTGVAFRRAIELDTKCHYTVDEVRADLARLTFIPDEPQVVPAPACISTHQAACGDAGIPCGPSDAGTIIRDH